MRDCYRNCEFHQGPFSPSTLRYNIVIFTSQREAGEKKTATRVCLCTQNNVAKKNMRLIRIAWVKLKNATTIRMFIVAFFRTLMHVDSISCITAAKTAAVASRV